MVRASTTHVVRRVARPALRECCIMVVPLPSKQKVRVRFPPFARHDLYRYSRVVQGMRHDGKVQPARLTRRPIVGLPWGTCECCITVVHLLAMQEVRVRFPSLARYTSHPSYPKGYLGRAIGDEKERANHPNTSHAKPHRGS